MEVNSSKCAQSKVSRLGQVNVVGIRSVVAHILTFSLVSVQQSPALIGSTVHVVHASICWSCYRRFRMHTLIRYARDSKRNVACDVSERRDAGKNDTRGSILVIRPIIALEFSMMHKKSEKTSFRRSWFVQKIPIRINYNRFTCSNFETIETVCRHKGITDELSGTRPDDRIDYADETISSTVKGAVTNINGTLKHRTRGKKEKEEDEEKKSGTRQTGDTT